MYRCMRHYACYDVAAPTPPPFTMRGDGKVLVETLYNVADPTRCQQSLSSVRLNGVLYVVRCLHNDQFTPILCKGGGVSRPPVNGVRTWNTRLHLDLPCLKFSSVDSVHSLLRWSNRNHQSWRQTPTYDCVDAGTSRFDAAGAPIFKGCLVVPCSGLLDST